MLSIIIPVLNEESVIAETVGASLSLPGDHEVIVVDGGSSDATCDEVRKTGARLVDNAIGSSPGIDRQLNQGIAAAHGEVLMFLHADVRLPNRAVELVQEAMAGDFVAGGGFLPHFTGNVSGGQRRLLQGVERVWRERTRRFTWFAGDTAPFVRATRLAVAGGYPMTGFASDWDFATILRSLGRLAVISDSVLVNARRHILNGVVKTLAVTGSVEAMYHMGVNRPFLRRWYKRWLPSDR